MSVGAIIENDGSIKPDQVQATELRDLNFIKITENIIGVIFMSFINV